MTVHPEDVGADFAGRGGVNRPGKKDMQPAGEPEPVQQPVQEPVQPDDGDTEDGPGAQPNDMQPA